LEIFNLKTEAFGLDISDLSLKIIKLKKRRKAFDLASFGEAEIKPGIIKDGEIKDEKKLAEIIKKTVKSVNGEKLNTKYVVASLPEEKAFLQVIQMPKMAEEDLKSALIYEAENYIPIPIEEVYLDFQIIEPLQNHLDHFDVLIIALPKKIVDSYVNSLKMAGLQPIAFEVESQSVIRALIKNEIAPNPVLIIDLAETKSNFIIFSGTCVRFTFCVPVSSQLFTQVIAKNIGVTFEEAEKLKIKYGLEENIKVLLKDDKTELKKERGQVFESLVPSLVDLVQQIKRHQDYYRTYSSHEHLSSNSKGIISNIMLCGGGANLKGLSEILILELKNLVELGNPWINVFPEGKKEAKNLSFEKSLKYTTAIGLALRGVKGNK